MARESYESRTRRQARQQDPIANLNWQVGAVKVLKESGARSLMITDSLVVENGWTEEHLRMLTKHGYLRMHSTWEKAEPTAHTPAGKKFAGYVWEVTV